MDEPSHATWRNRFILLNVVQIGGSLLGLFGLLLWQSSYVVAGGSWIGFPVTLIGLAAAFFAPRLLVRRWKTRPPQ